MLIQCPDCEKEVSDRAKACPHCAYPIELLTNYQDAIQTCDRRLVQDLIRSGHNVNEIGAGGITPLMLAAQKGSFEITKVLVDAGADVNRVRTDGTSALMDAAVTDSEKILQFLLERGADPAFKNDSGMTALDIAVKRKKPVAIRILRRLLAEPMQELPEPQIKLNQPAQKPAEKNEMPEAPVAVKQQSASLPAPEKKPLPELPKPKASATHEPVIPESLAVGFADNEELLDGYEDETKQLPAMELNCRNCQSVIAVEDIWCAHCKAPVIRRYCGGCKRLIPETVITCPYCNSAKVRRFRYVPHLEQIVVTAAVMVLFLLLLGIYMPDQDSKAPAVAQTKSVEPQQTTEPVSTKPQNRTVQIVDAINDSSVKQRANIQKASKVTSKPAIMPEDAERSTNETTEPENQIDQNDSELRRDEEEPKETAAVGNNEAEQSSESNVRMMLANAQRLNNHGFRLMKNGHYREAIPILQEALRAVPPGKENLTYAYALYNLGRSLRLAGRPDLAIPILKQRMEIPNQLNVVAWELELARRDLATEAYGGVQSE